MAIIGCGAVTEQFHLPAAVITEGVTVTALIDRNLPRARELAQQFEVGSVFEDYHGLNGEADAAIIALPHYLHAPVSIDLIQQGMHVLVEKPMALSAEECTRMIEAAREHEVTLAVGLMRRFQNSHQMTDLILREGLLGPIRSFDIREGSVFSWPIASDFFFRREYSGGGVLIDTGAHTLDSVLWWFGECETATYYDDNFGGVEADCYLPITMKNGIEGTVELSRTRNLRNTAIIRGDRGVLEVDMVGSRINLKPAGLGSSLRCEAIGDSIPSSSDQSYHKSMFAAQLNDFVQAVIEGRKPMITGEEGRRSIAFIESCYAHRKEFKFPWKRPVFVGQKENHPLNGKKVLVTGGTGFIGGELVECLVRECGTSCRVLVRNFTRVPRIARFPIEMVPGDITDADAVMQAMEGCDIVFHCAYGNTGTKAQQRQVNVQGTENVLKAALECGVKRMVHVSTLSVYGPPRDGRLDETAQRHYSREAYADSKLDAEKKVFSYYQDRDLPVVVIQPTVVFGPLAPAWTVGPLNRLKRGRIILVEGGGGFCNAVYINDVIQALVLAAIRENVTGKAFLISGEEPRTWKEFYELYEKMLGEESTVPMDMDEIRKFMRDYRKEYNLLRQALKLPCEILSIVFGHPEVVRDVIHGPAFTYLAGYRHYFPPTLERRLRSLISGGKKKPIARTSAKKSILPLTNPEIAYYRAKTQVDIGNATNLLGYRPKYNLEEGMQLTGLWFRFNKGIFDRGD